MELHKSDVIFYNTYDFKFLPKLDFKLGNKVLNNLVENITKLFLAVRNVFNDLFFFTEKKYRRLLIFVETFLCWDAVLGIIVG